MDVMNIRVKYIRKMDPPYQNLKEWMADEDNVYIGREGVVFIDGERYPKQRSIWANPFKVDKDGTLEEVLAMYKEHIIEKMANGKISIEQLLSLRDKHLGCWCAPDPCHGDILKKLVRRAWRKERRSR
jgi:hypothetical protein